MIRKIKDFIGYYICEAAFCFDAHFLKNLPEDESKWGLRHKVGYSIFKFIYSVGSRLYR